MRIQISLNRSISASDSLIVYRSQFGDTLNSTEGEAGYGIYAHLPSSSMFSYYRSNGENSLKLTLTKSAVIDCTEQNVMTNLLNFAKLELINVASHNPGYYSKSESKKYSKIW